MRLQLISAIALGQQMARRPATVRLPELSSVGQTGYAFATLITNAANHATYLQFDYYLGRPVNAQDANGTVFAGFYNDSLDRPTQVIRDSTTSRQRAKPLSVMTTLIGP